MDDLRVGRAIRSVRRRRQLRQSNLARLAGVSQATVSRIERGHLGSISTNALRAVGSAIDVRLELVARWRAGDLDRLLNSAHSGLHESVARSFRTRPRWLVRPEISFSIYGERGVVDLVAWHPDRRALCIIELKTSIVDVNELIGVVDRKRRLGPRIVANLGWAPATVSVWVIVGDGRTNRRRIQAHQAVLRAAFLQTAGRCPAGCQCRIGRSRRSPSGQLRRQGLGGVVAGPFRPLRRDSDRSLSVDGTRPGSNSVSDRAS